MKIINAPDSHKVIVIPFDKDKPLSSVMPGSSYGRAIPRSRVSADEMTETAPQVFARRMREVAAHAATFKCPDCGQSHGYRAICPDAPWHGRLRIQMGPDDSLYCVQRKKNYPREHE